jgi:hypothetical protein
MTANGPIALPSMPLWITDLHRASLMADPDTVSQVAQGLSADGSSQGYLYTDVLKIEVKKRLLRKSLIQVTLGARQVTQLRELLPLRLPFARSLTVAGPQCQLMFNPAEQSTVSMEGGSLTVGLSSTAELLRVLLDREGKYILSGLSDVEWHIQKTLLTNAEGEVVATYG